MILLLYFEGIKTGRKLKQEISRRMDVYMDLIETEDTVDGRSKVIKKNQFQL